MRVALIHDHLAQDGGAEKVLKVLTEMFPEAPIYTLLYEKKNADKYFKNRRIETSIIQKLPGGIKHYQWYMPFMPMAVEFFDLREYDLVISGTSSFAKGVITSIDTLHICYCHTPTRYLWDYTHQYINELKYNKYLKKIISLILNYIRVWDKQAAERVDTYIANSGTIKKRIKKYYRRDSAVIYPPVEIENFHISDGPKDYFLIGGRLAPYKRVDIVVEAFKNSGKKLKIFGDGVDLERLKGIAAGSKNIEFLGRVDDKAKAELYSHCRAFLNPQEEDFGITVIEAMASGRPIIAFRKGGATETVVEWKTGIFFDEQTPAAVAEAVENFSSEKWEPAEIRRQAERFSVEKFKKELRGFIEEEYRRFKEK
ncbi:MAG: glycosyltransferase [Patescibacteria group bacterium]|nr:glycosyltransferase [Patescibacteria group bacterium]MDD5295053.1 glycosyltransferase [Patescibacteria group bacterium]MDD5554173.1 glycosyltransferase [Patescibacteria group bacterium]